MTIKILTMYVRKAPESPVLIVFMYVKLRPNVMYKETSFHYY